MVFDEEMGIDNQFELLNGGSDANAELQKGAARRFKLGTFFSKKDGPHSVPTWAGKSKSFQAAANSAFDEYNERKGVDAKSTKEASSALEAIDKSVKQAAIQKAQKAAEERRIETGQKRKISLCSSPSPSASASPRSCSPSASPEARRGAASPAEGGDVNVLHGHPLLNMAVPVAEDGDEKDTKVTAEDEGK